MTTWQGRRRGSSPKRLTGQSRPGLTANRGSRGRGEHRYGACHMPPDDVGDRCASTGESGSHRDGLFDLRFGAGSVAKVIRKNINKINGFSWFPYIRWNLVLLLPVSHTPRIHDDPCRSWVGARRVALLHVSSSPPFSTVLRLSPYPAQHLWSISMGQL